MVNVSITLANKTVLLLKQREGSLFGNTSDPFSADGEDANASQRPLQMVEGLLSNDATHRSVGSGPTTLTHFLYINNCILTYK